MRTADVVVIGADPDGVDINVDCGSTHLAALQGAVVAEGAAMGLAFDGDGDRAAIAKGRTSVELDTYFEDPAGYVIQLISALET